MKHSILLLLLPAVLLAAGRVEFREHVIATDLAGGYQVTPLDVNRDGKTDLVALASGMSELVWFEAPSWERRVLATEVSRMINLAACSEDADGYPVIVLAQGFNNQAARSVGAVVVLERAGDAGEPWRKREIDRIPTSHRIRCADIDGSGRKVVINAPLTGLKAERPDYRDHVPLVYYKPGEWKRRLIGEENEGVMHGVYIHDWNRDGRDDVLTASFVGIHAYSLSKDGGWQRTEIAKGDPSPWPKSGSSDIAVGQVSGHRFIASIEPWHGHQLAVYRDGKRTIVDDTLNDGHTVVTVDLNGDNSDEIIAGFRKEP
ncbi:MAG: VCBS repeat-containing protein, partial [bacterium]|nr:VCBS repeat-containing protein [bacterium]